MKIDKKETNKDEDYQSGNSDNENEDDEIEKEM